MIIHQNGAEHREYGGLSLHFASHGNLFQAYSRRFIGRHSAIFGLPFVLWYVVKPSTYGLIAEAKAF